MTTPAIDRRGPQRQAEDERIASEPQLAPLALHPETAPVPIESLLGRQQRPVAVVGIVENGLIRPLDPGVKLPEHSRVIIVAAVGS